MTGNLSRIPRVGFVLGFSLACLLPCIFRANVQKRERMSNVDLLFDEVRVLCFVLTSPKSRQKAARVQDTWGARCNRMLFMTAQKDHLLNNSVVLDVERDEYRYLWNKTKTAFKHVFYHHFEEADWFVKADDDTYMIVENLRSLLSAHSAADPLYFGLRFRKFVAQGYMAGGPGYVLSKEALRRLVEVGMAKKDSYCSKDGYFEDVQMGKCMQEVQVMVDPSCKARAVDTRDEKGRARFLNFPPIVHLQPGGVGRNSWLHDYLYHPLGECCSSSVISFHYVDPTSMLLLDYLLYGARDPQVG